ncbi:hypothetical protein ACH4SK_43720 [Streptomyces inhibens]|uniref:hypothetical protein n=1 Tax=Streptomyces inhibens TaxID=2293571 RepID=UPI003788AC7A
MSDRVWLDVSKVSGAYYGNRPAFNEREVASLRLGLGKVSSGIELVESSPYTLIAARALEILEADYAETDLAPAIAGWAETEFSLSPRRCHVTRGGATGQFTFDWDE